jgi:alkanesulfonate monooxygenase SsuD/methylene tetrahydromethanopterin reductase-like flavin-dependent oxidoreductase (luciferase family)
VKFSLFFELQMSDTSVDAERRLFHDAVQQAVLADEIGYHCIWAVEHHGLYEYSHCSAPEVFLSFVAARTKRIRIGHGCVLLPYRYNHPLRVAERVAALDILSGGRVSMGTAKSLTRVEREAFEIDPTDLPAQWREAIEIIPRMWTEAPFSYKGKFFNIPPTYVVPRPVQTPHPPIFGACSRPLQAVEMGKIGLGALNLAMHDDQTLTAMVRDYRDAVQATDHVGMVTNHFSCNPATLVLRDDDKACRYGLRGARYFSQLMYHYSGPTRPVGPAGVSQNFPNEDYVRHFQINRNTMRSQLSSIIGDPASARETVQRFVDAGVDELILVMQTGPTPHELIMESIRTFGEDVMTYF